jgi:predicted aminopeptidase
MGDVGAIAATPRVSLGSIRATHRVAAIAVALCTLGGCSSIEFYWQGIAGQLDLYSRAKPIDAVVETATDPALKERLARAKTIRAFASRELALPDNGSYTRYADLGRAYVVWNVFAAPELSLTPRQWCFPIAGCVNYRGYFAEADARAEGARLAATGDDVHVGGVPAYSTLGYFDDPVLSSFIGYREPELARLLFHELAHQVVYVKDDTAFNESFAVAVEEEGLRRWLEAQRERPDAAALAAAVARAAALQSEFRAMVRRTRERLTALYASDLPDADKRAGKAAAFAQMRAEHEAMKAAANGAPVFDRWFAAGANNAGIAAVALYEDRVPEFRALLAAEGGDLPRFYARVKAIAALPKAGRDAALRAG